MKRHDTAAGVVDEKDELMRTAVAGDDQKVVSNNSSSAVRRNFVQTAAGVQKDKQNLATLGSTGFLAPAPAASYIGSDAAAPASGSTSKDPFHLATMTKKQKRELKHEKLMSSTSNASRACLDRCAVHHVSARACCVFFLCVTGLMLPGDSAKTREKFSSALNTVGKLSGRSVA